MSLQICSSVSFDSASDGAASARSPNKDSDGRDGGAGAILRRGNSGVGRDSAIDVIRLGAAAALAISAGATAF